MAAIQEISARIGRVTGCGIAANLRKNYPKTSSLCCAVRRLDSQRLQSRRRYRRNGSGDAAGAAGQCRTLIVIFGIGSLAGVLLVPYSTYAKYLKWLTISLFSYVGVVFFAHVSWRAVLHATFLPHIELSKDYLTALVAVLGTTISPYLFFWQASQEVEEVRGNHGEKPLKRAPSQAQEQLGRIRIDTYVGMAFSNVVAFFIILTAAATLHAHGITRNFDVRPGRKSIGAPGWTFRLSALCLRHCRHGTAGRSGACRVGLLRNWRGLPMENQP